MSNVGKNLIKILAAFVLMLGVFTGIGGSQEAAAAPLTKAQKAKIVKDANAAAKKYGYTAIDPKKVKLPKGAKKKEFKSVKELEAFLKKEAASKAVKVPVARTTATSKTKTYTNKYIDKTAVSKIVSYAKVKKVSGKIKSVNIWSEQLGVIFAMKWDEKTTWKKLNSKKTSGTAYIRGVKEYGFSIVGQDISYDRSVTYKVSLKE